MGKINEGRRVVRSLMLQYKLPNKKVDRLIHGVCVIVPVEEQQQSTGIDNAVADSTLKPCASNFAPSC